MKKQIIYSLGLLFLMACNSSIPSGKKIDQWPSIFPDYAEVTIPPNIAPLNFSLTTPAKTAYARFSYENHSFQVKAKKRSVFSSYEKMERDSAVSEGESTGSNGFCGRGGRLVTVPVVYCFCGGRARGSLSCLPAD